MPHPYSDTAIAHVHSQLYSGSNPVCIQAFSSDTRLLNPNGDNPVILPTQPKDKVLLGLEESAIAFNVSIYGRGRINTNGDEIDDLCQPERQWELSFDDGETLIPFTVWGTIEPDASMKCWKFTLVKSSRG